MDERTRQKIAEVLKRHEERVKKPQAYSTAARKLDKQIKEQEEKIAELEVKLSGSAKSIKAQQAKKIDQFKYEITVWKKTLLKEQKKDPNAGRDLDELIEEQTAKIAELEQAQLVKKIARLKDEITAWKKRFVEEQKTGSHAERDLDELIKAQTAKIAEIEADVKLFNFIESIKARKNDGQKLLQKERYILDLEEQKTDPNATRDLGELIKEQKEKMAELGADVKLSNFIRGIENRQRLGHVFVKKELHILELEKQKTDPTSVRELDDLIKEQKETLAELEADTLLHHSIELNLRKKNRRIKLDSPFVAHIWATQVKDKSSISDEEEALLELFSPIKIDPLYHKVLRRLALDSTQKQDPLELLEAHAELFKDMAEYAVMVEAIKKIRRDAQDFIQTLPKLENFAIRGDFQVIRNADGSRCYVVDCASKDGMDGNSFDAYLLDSTGKLGRKFSIRPFDKQDAKKYEVYFEIEVISNCLITEYIKDKDWSEYDGRVSLDKLSLVERITVLCEMLRELAEKKRPSRNYVWPRVKIEKLNDVREGLHLLAPVIFHYLRVPDPLSAPSSSFIYDFNKWVAELLPQPVHQVMQNFMFSMYRDNTEERPDAHKLLHVFEALRDYCANPNKENLEILESVADPTVVYENVALPESFKAQWLIFLHASKEENYKQNPVKWQRYAQAILEKMDQCTGEQVEILFLELFFKHGAKPFQEEINIEALGLSELRAQQLREVIEVAEANPGRSFVERLELFRFAEKHAPYFQRLIDEVSGIDLDMELFHKAPDEITKLKYEKRILSNFNAYTTQQMLIFVQAVQSPSLQNKIIEKLISGLISYKENLFYFNPRRLTINKYIRALENRHFDGLHDLPQKLPQTVPLKYINALKNSRDSFKSYRHYDLIKVDDKTFYRVDFDKVLGSGAYGTVYEAYRVDPNTGECGEKFAVKQVTWEESQERIEQEVSGLRKHFFVEAPMYRGLSKGTYIISEYVPGESLLNDAGDLNDSFGKLSIEERIKAIVMMGGELNRTHHPKIDKNKRIINAHVHGDIKPGNIKVLIEEGKVKDIRVLDYGVAEKLESDDPTLLYKVKNPNGTMRYISPETAGSGQSGIKSDIRPWGITILSMLNAYAPLRGGKSAELNRWVVNKTFSFNGIFSGMKNQLPLELQALLIQFIRKMLSYEYKDRPSSDESLRFFNDIYNYFQRSPEDKANWLKEKYEDMIQKSSPEDKWALFLYYIEDESHAKSDVVAQLAKILKPEKERNLTGKLKLLQYFNKNRVGNEAEWRAVVKNICNLKDEPKDYNSALLVFFKDFLSKTENYPDHKRRWKMLAEIIASNIKEYSGQEMLTFLRKLNKFNKNGEYNAIRNIVREKLLRALTIEKPEEEQAVQKIQDAVTENYSFPLFKRYRTKTALRSASKNLDLDVPMARVVQRLGKKSSATD